MVGMTNAGGGSAALNFKIVGGTTTPSSPSENTIWVNTSTPISDWIFSASQPSSPSAGLVWIRTGISSTAPFSALKRKVLMVYPSSAKQYVNGAWVDVTAQSYQNNDWVNWSLILYEPGNVHQETTGGYEAKAIRYATTIDGYTIHAKAPTVTPGSSSLVISLQNNPYGDNNSGSALTVNKIDLTSYQKITFEGSFVFANPVDSMRFYVSGSNTDYSPDAEVIVPGNNVPSSGKVTVNVAGLSGEYYVGVNILTGASEQVTNSVTLTRIVCE